MLATLVVVAATLLGLAAISRSADPGSPRRRRRESVSVTPPSIPRAGWLGITLGG